MAYRLTPLGENRALRIDKALDPGNAVIAYMYETKDPLEVEEIAGELRMNEETAERILNRLVSTGYVKEV